MKLSRADVKQSNFKNDDNLTEEKRARQDPKGRTIGGGAGMCFSPPHQRYETFVIGIVLVFFFFSFTYSWF